MPLGLEAVLRDGTRVAPLIVTALIIMGALAYTTSVYRIDRIYALGCHRCRRWPDGLHDAHLAQPPAGTDGGGGGAAGFAFFG